MAWLASGSWPCPRPALGLACVRLLALPAPGSGPGMRLTHGLARARLVAERFRDLVEFAAVYFLAISSCVLSAPSLRLSLDLVDLCPRLFICRDRKRGRRAPTPWLRFPRGSRRRGVLGSGRPPGAIRLPSGRCRPPRASASGRD